jgi:hypothetical protein
MESIFEAMGWLGSRVNVGRTTGAAAVMVSSIEKYDAPYAAGA